MSPETAIIRWKRLGAVYGLLLLMVYCGIQAAAIRDTQAKKAPQGVNQDAIAKRMRVSATRARSGWKITLDYPQLKSIIDRVLSVG